MPTRERPLNIEHLEDRLSLSANSLGGSPILNKVAAKPFVQMQGHRPLIKLVGAWAAQPQAVSAEPLASQTESTRSPAPPMEYRNVSSMSKMPVLVPVNHAASRVPVVADIQSDDAPLIKLRPRSITQNDNSTTPVDVPTTPAPAADESTTPSTTTTPAADQTTTSPAPTADNTTPSTTPTAVTTPTADQTTSPSTPPPTTPITPTPVADQSTTPSTPTTPTNAPAPVPATPPQATVPTPPPAPTTPVTPTSTPSTPTTSDPAANVAPTSTDTPTPDPTPAPVNNPAPSTTPVLNNTPATSDPGPSTTPSTTPASDTSTSVSPTNNQANAQQIAALIANLIGDGVHDDLSTMQALVDATPTGGTLTLPAGKTFFESQALMIPKGMTLDLNGSTIALSNFTGYPTDCNIIIRSAFSDSISFQQTLTKGSTQLDVATTAPVGSMAYVTLGTSPLDPHEPDWTGFVKILANDGQHITIDTALPQDISGTNQTINIISSFANNVTIKGGTLESRTIDGGHMASIWAEDCENVTFQDLTLNGPGILVDHLQNVTGTNITINNRFRNEMGIWGWDIRNGNFDGITWTAGSGVRPGDTQPPQFSTAEGFTTSFNFQNVTINAPADALLYNCQPDSYINFGKVTANVPSLTVVNNGGHIDELDLNGGFIYCDFGAIAKLDYNGQVFQGAKTVDMTIPVASLTNGQSLNLPTGLYSDFEVFTHGVTGDIYLANNGNEACNIASSSPIADQWTWIQNGSVTGTGLGPGDFDDPLYLTRNIVGFATGDQNAWIEIKITYFPALNG